MAIDVFSVELYVTFFFFILVSGNFIKTFTFRLFFFRLLEHIGKLQRHLKSLHLQRFPRLGDNFLYLRLLLGHFETFEQIYSADLVLQQLSFPQGRLKFLLQMPDMKVGSAVVVFG